MNNGAEVESEIELDARKDLTTLVEKLVSKLNRIGAKVESVCYSGLEHLNVACSSRRIQVHACLSEAKPGTGILFETAIQRWHPPEAMSKTLNLGAHV